VKTPYQGYFINLDRNADRRARMETQLHQIGLSECYKRITAFDGAAMPAKPEGISKAEYGCFASHIDALAQGSFTGNHLHILEDDAVLSPSLRPVVSKLVSQGVFDQVDILFTDVGVRPDSSVVGAIQRIVGNQERATDPEHTSVKLLDLNRIDWTTTTSYLVAKRSVGRLRDTLAADLRGTPQFPLDLKLRALVKAGQFRAFVCLPFLTSIALDLDFNSSIRDPDVSRMVCNILRQAFYVDCDVNTLEMALRQYCPSNNLDRRRKAMLDAIAFTMFGDFRTP
jgi:hypothetical protein